MTSSVKIGIAIGCSVAGLIFIGSIVWVCFRRRKTAQRQRRPHLVEDASTWSKTELAAGSSPIPQQYPLGHLYYGLPQRREYTEMSGQRDRPEFPPQDLRLERWELSGQSAGPTVFTNK